MRIAISIIGLFIAAGITPAPAGAKESPQASAAAGAHVAHEAAKAPKEKRICRRFQASETRLRSVRVCLTAGEWKARDRRSS